MEGAEIDGGVQGSSTGGLELDELMKSGQSGGWGWGWRPDYKCAGPALRNGKSSEDTLTEGEGGGLLFSSSSSSSFRDPILLLFPIFFLQFPLLILGGQMRPNCSLQFCGFPLNFFLLYSLLLMAWRRCSTAAMPLERRQQQLKNTVMEDDHGMALRYLLEFGHLTTPIPTPAEMRAALETFQDMAGLAKSGQLDAETLEAMRMPRCGNGDVSRTQQRRRRFVYISRWEDKVKDGVLRLKWFIQNYTPDISREQIRDTVNKTFSLWSSQVKIQPMQSISLIFEEAPTEAEADITILWAEGDHGDAHKFDGPGEDGSNILAHTFYPNYQFKGTLNGDIHLDDFEEWRAENGREGGASFPHVLVHEIGHTLGLGHSKKQQAIMFPIYRKEQLDQMQLDIDDKCAINWSYVGATDLCLYIWLLSEVLPKKVAMEEGGTKTNNNGESASSNMLEQNEENWEPPNSLLVRAQLAGRAMPECGAPETPQGHRMRHQLTEMLRRRLGFPKEIAQPYSNILCRFFDGFRHEFGLPGTGHLHQVIRPIGAHSYLQLNDNFAALERALNREGQRQFDAEFFNKLMATFIGDDNENDQQQTMAEEEKKK